MTPLPQADDPESIATLQEWFGYCLTADTSLQKALMMIGPKRSGKGTICRALKGVVGIKSTASINLIKLTERFGLQSLLGKSLAIVEDCRLSDRDTDNSRIVENLLTITGEGSSTVDRKNLPALDVVLGVRFTLCSNELPGLSDPSLALPSRLLVLRMTKSFIGKEDRTLFKKKIKPELPGILLWAVEGWRRVQERGRFQQPESARGLIEALEEVASPMADFVDERCILGKSLTVTVKDLYDGYKDWCKETEKKPKCRQLFGKELLAAVAGIRRTRPRAGEKNRPRIYEGIDLIPVPQEPASEYASSGYGRDD